MKEKLKTNKQTCPHKTFITAFDCKLFAVTWQFLLFGIFAAHVNEYFPLVLDLVIISQTNL